MLLGPGAGAWALSAVCGSLTGAEWRSGPSASPKASTLACSEAAHSALVNKAAAT